MSDAQLDLFRAEFFKALAHPIRIKILRLLRPGEKSVTELQKALGLESSNVSQQLMILRAKNLVVARKEGAKAFYAVRDPQIFQLLDSAREIFDRHLIDSRAMLNELEQEDKVLSESGSVNASERSAEPKLEEISEPQRGARKLWA